MLSSLFYFYDINFTHKMNFPKAVFWIDCFVLALSALHASNTSVEILAGTVNVIANFFSLKRVDFLSIGLPDEKLAKAVSQKLSTSFGFFNLSTYHGVLKKEDKHQCHAALRVISEVNQAEDLQDFNQYYTNHASKVRSGVWLLFTESFGDNFISQLLKDIHLPLDTEIMVAWIYNDTVHLKEVYQVAPSHPIRQIYFGNWSFTKSFNFRKPYPGHFGRTDLEGLKLRVGYIKGNTPYTMMRCSSKGCVLEGFFGEIWNALENLLNISSTLVKVDLNRENGNNNSWLNIMKMLDEKKIEVGLGDFIPSDTRIDYFDFSHPLFTSDFQVFYRYIPSGGYSKMYLHLFANDTWLSLLTWAVINSVCISGTTYLRKRFFQKKGKLITAQTSFFMTLKGLCAQGSSDIPRFSSCRILFLFTYIVAAVVIPSFSASLTRHLTSKPSGITFHNLNNIYEKGFHKLTVVDGSYEYFIFKLNNGKNIWEKVFVEHLSERKLPKSYGEALRLTCKNKNVALFTITSTLVWELNKKENVDLKEECLLKKMKQNAGKSMNAIIFPKNSRFKKLIDHHLKILHSTGVINKLQQKYWPNRLNFSKKKWEPVSLVNSLALFHLVLCGGILSAFLIILEQLIKKSFFLKSCRCRPQIMATRNALKTFFIDEVH